MENDLISGAAGAAEFLGLPRRQVYRMVEEGRLPHVRMGRRLFFRKSSLDRAFEARPNVRITRKIRLNGITARVVIEPGPRQIASMREIG